MEYIRFGKSDLKVSRICMGCMGLGDPSRGMNKWAVPETESREIIRYALSQGINFFDTAMSYQEGNSEEVLGRALRDFAKREDYVVATKFLPRSEDEMNRHVSGQEHVMDCLDKSLKRLGLGYVDLYIYHMWDYHTPMEEIMEGLHAAVQTGKTRYIGISNCYAWQLAKVNFYAREHSLTEFISNWMSFVGSDAHNLLWGVIAMVLSIVVSFVLTLVFGFGEDKASAKASVAM